MLGKWQGLVETVCACATVWAIRQEPSTAVARRLDQGSGKFFMNMNVAGKPSPTDWAEMNPTLVALEIDSGV